MPAPEAVRAEVNKILSSALLQNAPRLSRFLDFVVEKTISGESESIKEYLIGVEVFQKTDFDPSTSSQVRVQARNLRDKLAEYYQTDGRADSLLIELPKGSYVPTFRPRNTRNAPTPEAVRVAHPVRRESESPRSSVQAQSKRAALRLGGAALTIAIGFAYWVFRPLPQPTLRQTRPLTHDGFEKRGPMLTDGTRLYLTERRGHRWLLVSVLLGGGETSVVPLPVAAVQVSDISRDGGRFLGWDTSGDSSRMITWPVTGGPPDYTGVTGGSWATWSPDGARIAYVDENNRLMIVGPNTNGPREISASVSGLYWWPEWTPDSKTLRFSLQGAKSQTYSLWEVDADRGKPYRLLSGWAEAPVRISPAGWTFQASYSFISSLGPVVPPPDRSERGDRPDVWIMRETCGMAFWRCRKPLPLAIGGARYYALLPNRDGRSIFAIGIQSAWHLERSDRRSGAFFPYLSGQAATDLDFSKDGKSVVYTRVPDYTLWRSNADGSDERQLTSAAMLGESREPHWSPDGAEIAFLGVSRSQHYKAYVIAAGGGFPKPLVEGDGEEGVPTWSPDGKSLVWGDPLNRRAPPEMLIHKLDINTSQVTNLPDSSGLWTPRWSPDGRYVAALAVDALTGDVQSQYPGAKFRPPGLWLFNVGTGRWACLVPRLHIDQVRWAQNSRVLYFSIMGKDPGIYQVQVTGGDAAERILGLSGLSSESEWAGMTPDGSPLVARSFNVQEVYAIDFVWR